jgi:hypothetical protein
MISYINVFTYKNWKQEVKIIVPKVFSTSFNYFFISFSYFSDILLAMMSIILLVKELL